MNPQTQYLSIAHGAAAICLALSAALPAQAQAPSPATDQAQAPSPDPAQTQVQAQAQAPAQATAAPSAGSGMQVRPSGEGYSILPYTRSGYAGVNLGKPDWRVDCTSGFNCEDPDLAVYVYTGGLINDVIGVELGYINSGSAERNGGKTRAQGVNLSLVARLPLGAFNVFAKAGALYGETRVSADAASGVATGTERGWGGAYAVGAGYDFTPQVGMVLEWARHEFRFAGSGRRELDSLSLGLVRRF